MANKLGRWKRKASNINYKNSNRRRLNKLRRIERSCGPAFARWWDGEHGAGRAGYLARGGARS